MSVCDVDIYIAENLKLVATILAGFHALANTEASMWKDLCEKNGQDFSDPYIKTIFSLISTGNWKRVLNESKLPMADNLGIAFRYLNDDEVSDALID